MIASALMHKSRMLRFIRSPHCVTSQSHPAASKSAAAGMPTGCHPVRTQGLFLRHPTKLRSTGFMSAGLRPRRTISRGTPPKAPHEIALYRIRERRPATKTHNFVGDPALGTRANAAREFVPKLQVAAAGARPCYASRPATSH